MQDQDYEQHANDDGHDECESDGRRQLQQLRHKADQRCVDLDDDGQDGDRQHEGEDRDSTCRVSWQGGADHRMADSGACDCCGKRGNIVDMEIPGV